MSLTDDTTFKLFMRSVLDDDDHGYPDTVVFVSGDIANVDDVLWRHIHDERRAAVVVTGEDMELLIVPWDRPWPVRWFDELRGCVAVRVGWRHHEFASPYSVPTRVGRHALADMRRALPAA